MRETFLLAAVLAATACAGAPEIWRASEGVDYRVEISDNPALERFDMRLTSLSDRALCYSPAQWPSRGKVDSASTYVFAEIGERRYPIRDWNSGICVSGNACGSRLAPHAEVDGFIAYAEFPTAPFSAAEEHRLIFSIPVGRCYGGERS